jgi:Protein of unknown function (DUF3572)
LPLEPARNADITALADSCFAHVVADPDELMRFMNYAGYSPESIRQSIGTDSLNSALLDYFASHETALTAMCAASGFTPESFMYVWHRLNPPD